MKKWRLPITAIVLNLVILAGPGQEPASADMVVIVNPSFEANVLGDGAFVSFATGWNTPGAAGTYNPGTAQFFDEAPDGQNIAYASGGVSVVSQILATNLQADTVYTLTMEVGNRADITFRGYQIDLLAGSTILASDINSFTPPNGEFELATVSYVSTATDSALGEALQIRFQGLGAQVGFDDVRLDATSSSIPEPTSLTILVLSSIGLMLRRRSI